MSLTNIRQAALTMLISRCLCIVSLFLMTACVTTEYGPYTTDKNPIGETRDWKMALFPEPGQLSFTMKLAYASSANIALTSGAWTKTADIIVSSTECLGGHQVGIQYFTNDTDSYFKYFKLPASSEESFNILIAWQDDKKLSVSLNAETIELPMYKAIEKAEVSSHKGSVIIENVQYIKNPITSLSK